MDSGHFNSTGANNSFFGKGAGIGNTTGELNVFLGANTGASNVLGTSNTLIGANANVLGGNLSYATAIGAEAVATTSNSIFLGRPADTVKVPGGMTVTGALTVSGTLTASMLSVSSTKSPELSVQRTAGPDCRSPAIKTIFFAATERRG